MHCCFRCTSPRTRRCTATSPTSARRVQSCELLQAAAHHCACSLHSTPADSAVHETGPGDYAHPCYRCSSSGAAWAWALLVVGVLSRVVQLGCWLLLLGSANGLSSIVLVSRSCNSSYRYLCEPSCSNQISQMCSDQCSCQCSNSTGTFDEASLRLLGCIVRL
jgi:hypothetical protein